MDDIEMPEEKIHPNRARTKKGKAVNTELFCTKCKYIPLIPQVCSKCSKLLCTLCIRGMRCPHCQQNSIGPIPSLFLKSYNKLEVECRNIDNGCTQHLEFGNVIDHEKRCDFALVNCRYCHQPIQRLEIQEHLATCDEAEHLCPDCDTKMKRRDLPQHRCILVLKLKITMLEEENAKLKKENKELKGDMALGDQRLSEIMPLGLEIDRSFTPISFAWDTNKQSSNLTISDSGKQIENTTGGGYFPSALGRIKLRKGAKCFFFLRIERSVAEPHIKLGVSKIPIEYDNKGFSDTARGWSYYSKGCLRHGSASSGANYGASYRQGDVLGVFVDLIAGVLSFSKNGQMFGTAFSGNELLEGDIYPAVGILNSGVVRIL